MQFVLNRSNLQSAGIDASAVRVYHRVNGSWQAAETSVVEERTDQVVYEADTAGASAYAIGKIEPAFSITRTSVVSEQAPEGQRVVVEATVANDGSIEGPYDAQMRVDDAVVNQTSVTVPADTEQTVTLSTVVTTPGTFQITQRCNAGEDQESRASPACGNGCAKVPAFGTDGNALSIAGNTGLTIAPERPRPATVTGISTMLVIGGLLGALLLSVSLSCSSRGSNRDHAAFRMTDINRCVTALNRPANTRVWIGHTTRTAKRGAKADASTARRSSRRRSTKTRTSR